MASLTGFVRPILAKFCDFPWTLRMALFTVLQHFLMFLVRERHISHGSRQINNIGSKSGSSKSKQGNYYNYGFFMFISLMLNSAFWAGAKSVLRIRNKD
jgi:hypothetical protein